MPDSVNKIYNNRPLISLQYNSDQTNEFNEIFLHTLLQQFDLNINIDMILEILDYYKQIFRSDPLIVEINNKKFLNFQKDNYLIGPSNRFSLK